MQIGTISAGSETSRERLLVQVAAIDVHLSLTAARSEAHRRSSRIIARFIAPPGYFGSEYADKRREVGSIEWRDARRRARAVYPQLVSHFLAKIEGRTV